MKRSIHILLIEDDPSHQELVSHAFMEEAPQFRLSNAPSLAAAREILASDPPDLILADWILPDGKGIEILPRDAAGMVRIPLVIMTSHGSEEIAVEIMKSGAMDYLVKSEAVFRDLPSFVRRTMREWDNIHQRMQAEAAVAESQKKMADIISFLPDAVLAVDNDRRVIAWNLAAEVMTGISAEELLGKGDHAYAVPFYGEKRPILIDLVFEENPELEKKYVYVEREGETIQSEAFIPGMYAGKGAYLWGKASPLYDTAGNRIGAIEVIRDITGRKHEEMKSQDREATLATLLNAPSDTIALLDRDGNILEINVHGAERFGVRPEEIIGKNVYDLLPPDLARTRKEKIDEAFKNGERVQFEDRRKGSIFLNKIYPIFNEDHSAVDRVVIFASDITERVRTEEALREREEQFRIIFDRSSAGKSLTSAPDGRLLRVNQALADMLGYTVEELQEKNFADITHPDDLAESRECMRCLISGEKCRYRMEKRYFHKSWKIVWGDVTTSLMRDTAGNPLYLITTVLDITERKEAEAKLRESEERYRTLTDNVPDIIARFDREHRHLFVNKAVMQVSGIPPEFYIGKTNRDLNMPDDLIALWDEKLDAVFELGLPVSYEFTFSSQGKERFFESRLIPEPSTNGNVQSVISIVRDITERKRADATIMAEETRFRNLFSAITSGVAVFEATPDGRDFIFRDLNPAAELIDGVKKEDIIGHSVTDMFPDIARFGLLNTMRQVWKTGVPAQHPVTYYQDTRISGWRENYVYKLPSGEVVSVYNDVTEQKQAEDTIRNQLQEITSYYDKAPIGLAVLDRELHYLRINTLLAEMNGIPAADHIGKTVRELLPALADTVQQFTDEILATGRPKTNIEIDGETVARPGVLRTWRENWYPTRDIQGRITGFSVFVEEITEQKEAERAREQYSARLHSAMEIGHLAWWEMDMPSGMVRFDERKATMLGYDSDMFDHYSDFTNLLHPDDYEPTMQAMRDNLEWRKERYSADYRIRASDGKYLWFRDVGGVTKRLPDGSPATVTGIVIDITASKEAEEALHHSEQLLRQTQRLTKVGGWDFDIETGTGQWTDEVYEIYGIPPGTSTDIAESIECYSPEDRQAIGSAFREAVESGTPYDLTLRFTGHDGIQKWVRTTAHVDWANGKPARVYGNIMDVSEQVDAQAALEENEKKFRTVADFTYDWEYWTGPDNEYIYVSPACERISGYSREEFYKNKDLILRIVHPQDSEIVLKHKETLPTLPDPQTLEFRIVTKHGRIVWIGHICRPIFSPEGNFLGRRGTNRDITLEKIAEEALKENQVRLATAMDMAHLVNWELDVTARMFTFNDPFYALYGTTAEEEGGYVMPAETYVREFVHPDDIPYVNEVIAKAASITNPEYLGEAEHRIIRRDGEMRYIIVRFGVILDADGHLVKTHGVNQDITDRKLMESEIRSLNRVLELRVAERTEQLNSSLKEKELLLREIHHRVKNNVQVIASLLNWQSSGVKDETTREILQDAQDRVRSIALVHENLYRSENLDAIDYQEYLKKIIQYLYHTHSVNPSRVAVNVVGDKISLNIDKAIPCSLIVNEMITNAFKHAFPGNRAGTVEIGLYRQGTDVRLEYHDNGCGLPDTVTLDSSGTLGILLIGGLTKQLKGTITIGREGGTHYTLIFPM